MTEAPAESRAAQFANDLSRPIGTPTYRYLFCDLLTDQLVADLPLTGVGFGRKISRTGDFKGQMEISNRKQALQVDQICASAGRMAVWVLRNYRLWWGGILWTAQPSEDSRSPLSVKFQAATFDSYPHRRYIRENITYTQVDQGVIIPDMWRRVQADPRGDIGVIAEDQPTGVLRDREYLATDVKEFGKAIEELGDVIDGPEHTIDVYLDGHERKKALRIGYPRLGAESDTGLVVSGYQIPSWSRTNDATKGGTAFQARGDSAQGNAAEEQEPLMSEIYYSDELLDAGWPLLDVTEDYSTVQKVSTLNEHARADRAIYSGQRVAPEYEIFTDQTDWEPNRLGEEITIHHSKRDLWQPGRRSVVRPVAVEVSPPEGDKRETIKITIEEE